MDIREGILATAGRLGMSPEDLATIISYETAGTFDPSKAGPTTKWGQHRGLIQFGEPQAKQYGVNWNDPIGSQLGEGGAVEQYFKGSGWQPGMGMLDAYSIVNAGGPGRYNASDTAAGGAPGTVRDKVEGQMAGHRAKAQALLGGNYAPQTASAPANTPKPSAGRPQAAPSPAAPRTTVAALTGAERPNVMGLLTMLADQQTQQPQQPADPRELFAANLAWAKQNGWRV